MKTSAGGLRLGGAPERALEGAHVLPALGKSTVAQALWTYGGPISLWLLILGAGLNGTTVQVHHLSVYPEYPAIGVAATWALLAWAAGRLRPYFPAALLPLMIWLAAALLGTLLHAPDRHASLVLWVKLPLMVAAYLLAANLARDRLGGAIGAQLAVASGVALVAIAVYASWRLTGSHLGMRHPGRNLGHAWLPAATLREPDILGSYLVAAALLALPSAMLLRHAQGRTRLMIWAAAGLAVVGIGISGARNAWLALLAGLAVPLLLAAARRPADVARRALLPMLALAAAAFALFIMHLTGQPVSSYGAALPAFNPHENGDLLQRVASFGDLSRDRDVVVRAEIARNALAHWQSHPLTGWGVGAYGQMFTYPPPDTIHRGWISNLPVHLLYDSGLLGLAAFAWAMALVARRGIRAWRTAAALDAARLAGLLLALFGLLLAFQATEATWFAYPWIYLGLLEAGTRRTAAGREPAAEAVPCA